VVMHRRPGGGRSVSSRAQGSLGPSPHCRVMYGGHPKSSGWVCIPWKSPLSEGSGWQRAPCCFLMWGFPLHSSEPHGIMGAVTSVESVRRKGSDRHGTEG
jgi:hypothetical protein